MVLRLVPSRLPSARNLSKAVRREPSASPRAAMASRTASGKVLSLAASIQPLESASMSALLRPAARAARSTPLSVSLLSKGVPERGWGLVAPRMKGWSRGSMLDARRLAASASVRATTRVEVPIMSHWSRAATRRSACSCAGTSTLPPMWPHFLVPWAWSSKCTPAAPRSTNIFMSFIVAVMPPWPVSPSATIGVRKSGRSSGVPLRTAASQVRRSWCWRARKSWSTLFGTVSLG
mmetsp:Transcript_9999/g.33960  ORF Transcript_9999/g.33960 Transcript_9999/m.33960 type:complete len:235 (-) Transcript_9999:486-1190(-)